ncbi:hypothetical protein LSAT2_029997, partial [Lamellibrachia satsuma]
MTVSGKWLTLAAMTDACDLGAAVSINRCIYLVGGFSWSYLKYNLATDSWTRPSQLCNAPAVTWQQQQQKHLPWIQGLNCRGVPRLIAPKADLMKATAATLAVKAHT